MTITPCKDCRMSPTCEIKREKIKAIRGLKLTSIKFRCDVKLASLLPGTVANVNFRYVDSADENGVPNFQWAGAPDDPRRDPATKADMLRGIVMKWFRNQKVWVFVPRQSGKCLVTLDSKDKQLHMVRVAHKDIVPTGEMVRVCKHCGMPEDALPEEKGDWHCRMEPSSYLDYETGYTPQELDCEYEELP